MNNKNITEWLINEDAKAFSSRLERLEFIISLTTLCNFQQFYGGLITRESFEEAKWCYINASYIACIALCQITIEHSLSSLFKAEGKDKIAKSNFYSLLKEAKKEELLTEEEFNFINELRKSRNRIAHPHDNIFDRVEFEAITRNIHAYEIIEENARHAITTCFNIYSRYPFSI